MAPDSLRRTASDSFDDFGVYLVSVEAVLDGTVELVCRNRSVTDTARSDSPPLDAVRSAGFGLLATFDRPHDDIALPDLSDDAISRLDNCFDAPTPNPGKHRPEVS